LIAAVFDSLTEVDADGRVVPALANTWSVSSDQKVWTFGLRPNVVFSDGTPLDADAIVDCLRFILGPETKTFGNTFFTEGIVSARTTGSYTVEIQTRDVDARFDRKMARVRIFSMPAFQRLGRAEFAKSPVGTGPYRPDSWTNGGRGVVLTAVPTSWRAPEQVDRVEILYVPDATVRLQALLSGATDIAHALDPDSLALVEQSGFKTTITPGSVVLAIAIQTTGDAAAPLGNPRVRVALNMAIDRETISRELLLGTMEPATQIATPGVLGYDPTIPPYTFDPSQAKRILAEAGYPDGFQMSALLYTGQAPGDHLVYQQVAQNLAAIGVKFDIQTFPISEHLRRRANGAWDGIDATASSWPHHALGDLSRAAEQFSCLSPVSTFCDRDVADLISQSNSEMNPATRENLLKTINRRYQELAPSIILFRFSSIDGMRSRIERFPQSTAKMYFEKARVTDH